MKHLTMSPQTVSMRHILPAVALLLTLACSHAQVIYQELFNNTAGSNQSESTIGWTSYWGSTGTIITAEIDKTFIAPLGGNPSTPNGYLALNNSSLSPNFANSFAMVENFSSALNIAGSTVTWTMGNNSTAMTARLLIQIGGDGTAGSGAWYASSQAFSNSIVYNSQPAFATATTSSVTQTLAFSTAAADWRSFTLTPGTTMSLGSVLGSDLSSSQITGIGLLVATPNSSVIGRFDTLTVTVPEPSSIAMFAGGLAFVLFGYRARCKACAPNH
ncbi:MAG: PEP-CTERM sorting domain-containing protein [Verrucomicrobia bacterium]|nr:PEP-CTERM sorting domain-containing protein [Verrucomicrobiota bacterium]